MTKADQDLQDVLRSPAVAPHRGIAAEIFGRFDAQIGEIGWHSVHVDESISEISETHATSIAGIIRNMAFEKPRILELGAYAHFSSQIAAHRSGGSSVSHDISAASVAEGQKRARDYGCGDGHTCVAGDFHDLPFADDSFDIVFIASAVHHTRRPGDVLREMVRVTRPGGVIHLENEPVGRIASLYQFRGNREGERTPFEEHIERLGLTRTVSSPFPGSRAEQLFGMVENERIPLEIYEETLLTAGAALQWSLDSAATIGSFEAWLLSRPSAEEIAARLMRDMEDAARLFSERDKASGFSVPNADQIWTLAYRLERELSTRVTSTGEANRLNASLFGAALKASIIKTASASVTANGLGSGLFRRKLREQDGVLVDDVATQDFGLELANILPPPGVADFGQDWTVVEEENGYRSLTNNEAFSRIKIDVDCDGIAVLRTYSIGQDAPYFFSVIRGDELVYRHCVTSSESHLAKFFVKRGERITICHHDSGGAPLTAKMLARMIPRFVPVRPRKRLGLWAA